MTERQKSLYCYLLEQSTTTEDFITKEAISRDLKELYPRHKEKTNEHNSSAFCNIREDVAALNQEESTIIIASSPKGYRVATGTEAAKYADHLMKKSLRSLKRAWKVVKKLQNNGQMVYRGNDLEIVKTILGE